MLYIPTKEELKELKFIKKRELGFYELQFTKDTSLCFDFNIEQEQKFYAIEWDNEVFLDFEDKEEVLFYIDTLKWLKSKK